MPLTRPWPVEPPTVPFPIIPIDTSSTWVCPWCFVGVVPTGVAFRQSHVRTARAFPDAMFHVKQFIALQCDKEQMFHVKHPVAEHEAKLGLAFLGEERPPTGGAHESIGRLMIEKICMVLIFVGVAVGVGIYCRRHTGSVDGFILGGRNVGPWLSAFAFGTSYFSAVIFVGYAGQFGWKYGVAATWIGIGNAILGSLLAWWVLGPRTREMTHRLGASTMPEFFGARFQSKGLRIAAAAIIFVFLIPYTASVYNGLSRLFGMAFGLPYEVCVIGMAVITCVYVVLGGYMATVMNDFIQGIVMLLGIVAVIVAVLVNNGGFTEALTTLSLIPAEGSEMAGPFVSFFGPNLPDLIGVIVLTSLGTWGLPQMVQKFYAIKSGPAIKQGAIISTVFAMVVAGGSYFLGGFGRLYGDQVEMTAAGTPVYDSIMPTMLSTLPDLLIGIVIVLVLSASMSTLSSLVLTSSSTLTLDLLKDNVVKNMSEKKISWCTCAC